MRSIWKFPLPVALDDKPAEVTMPDDRREMEMLLDTYKSALGLD